MAYESGRRRGVSGGGIVSLLSGELIDCLGKSARLISMVYIRILLSTI